MGIILALGLFSTAARAQTVLISAATQWEYWDRPEAPPASWRTDTHLNPIWPSGPAPLGFGEGTESTVIDADGERPAAFYFRHVFFVPDTSVVSRITLRLWRDDGALVYLNGQELARSNMPTGTVTHTTFAAVALEGFQETLLVQRSYNGAQPLRPGTNLLAVQVHQAEAGFHDARFDLELVANIPLSYPNVRITSPHDGQEFDHGPIEINVATSDVDGEIWRVIFFAGTNALGTNTIPPFDFDWNNVPTGRHVLKAFATDFSGRGSISDPVHIEVGPIEGTRVVRGPYLQHASPTNLTLCWRTDWFVNSVVYYGTNADMLDHIVRLDTLAINHTVPLIGLQPHTRYYYGIGSDAGLLQSGPDFYFQTPPTNAQPTRVWAIGDSGTADEDARAVRDAYLAATGNGHTDLWLMLGDNAYESGTDDEYQTAVFDTYLEMLRHCILWPTIGNHDSVPFFAGQRFPYLDIFELPTHGQSGGLASGTERYYSFDHGNIHFVCLDSSTSDRLPGSPMLEWLDHDLAATDKDWIIAFWHHPPYSFGSHNSDKERDLIEMREHTLPIIEQHGTDLVLCGHSHNYERSFLLRGFYGFSTNLQASMILDSSAGNPAIDHPYRKPAGGLGVSGGTVYAVCGCSGEGGHFTITRHPAMVTAQTGFGSVILDIDGLRLDAKFLRPDGSVDDAFSIVKETLSDDIRPTLEIRRSESNPTVELRWPTSMPTFHLESKPPPPGASWTMVDVTPERMGRVHLLSLPTTNGPLWFRLRGDP